MQGVFQPTSRERSFEYGARPANSLAGKFILLNRKNGEIKPYADVPAGGSLAAHEKRCWDYLNPGPPYHGGGTLFIKDYYRPVDIVGVGSYIGPRFAWQSVNGGKVGDDWVKIYRGGFCNPVDHGFTDSFYSQGILASPTVYNVFHPDDLSSLGSRAYAKLRPKVEKVNLAQSIFEAREIPRMLKTTSKGFSDVFRSLGGNIGGKSMTPKGVADHFLNVQFGWKPFLRDLNDTIDVVKNFDVYVARTKRNNNTWLKRYWAEDEILTEEPEYSGSPTSLECTPSLTTIGGENQFIVPGSIKVQIHNVKSSRVWHVGRFKYYRPEFAVRGDREFDTLMQARQMTSLLGLQVNPTTLYKVTPWTWLADWFVNVSDNVQRFEDMISNAVVSKYFYTMRQIRRNIRYRITAQTLDGQSLDLIWYRGMETKQRSAANSPFSFTLLPGGLSGQQLAILGALGLSKLAP